MSIVLTDTELRVFDTVDTIIEQSVTAGDPVPAMSFASELIRSGQIRGLALAKLFYGIKSRWELFQSAGIDDNFEDFTCVHTGYSNQTVKKYTRMWENIFENKDIGADIKSKLMGKDIKQLLLLSAVAGEGDVDMGALADTDDEPALRDKIKEAKGERTSSSSAIRIFLQVRDSGNFPVGCLFIRKGGETTVIGSLDVGSGNEDSEKAINRILNAAGVVEV
jgi:hypothetical protein